MNRAVINGPLASLLARFRHANTIAILDGPFPTYPLVETIDLSIVLGWPSIPQVLEAILPMLELTGLYLAEEFSAQVDPKTVQEYKMHHRGLATELITHAEFKERVGQCLGIIHTGDPVPYSSVILRSGS